MFLLQLENANLSVVKPLEDFRKKYIGGAKMEKKKFEKQTAKFCQYQERYLNLTTKKTTSLMEVSHSSYFIYTDNLLHTLIYSCNVIGLLIYRLLQIV